MRNVEFQGKVVEASDLTRQFRIPHSTFRIGCGAVIDLSGKRAFVTGGGRGIGRATAVLLARAGAKVAVGYRSRKPAAEAHVTAAVRGDLGTPTGASKAVAEALREIGRAHV